VNITLNEKKREKVILLIVVFARLLKTTTVVELRSRISLLGTCKCMSKLRDDNVFKLCYYCNIILVLLMNYDSSFKQQI
jgi:hypothetical protein